MVPGTMIEPIRWFERTWTFSLPAGAFPAVLERLRGTPARAVRADVGSAGGHPQRPHRIGAWSAKEHLAHLDDLHDLDEKRFDRVPRSGRHAGRRRCDQSSERMPPTTTRRACRRFSPGFRATGRRSSPGWSWQPPRMSSGVRASPSRTGPAPDRLGLFRG